MVCFNISLPSGNKRGSNEKQNRTHHEIFLKCVYTNVVKHKKVEPPKNVLKNHKPLPKKY